MPAMTPIREWTIAQHFAVWIGVYTVFVAVVGFAINPDFAVGDDATAEPFLGVDWNGWHAVAALLVGIPGVAVAWLPALAVPYLAYRAVVDLGVGIWAFADDRPLGVLYLPTNGDAITHVAIAAVAALGIAANALVRGRAETV